ncbi:uroporphyrinogen-III C-methyltransferase [Halarsenatibacter silvermanii]|nr:uroporphyrinogen-III C-methyltransferase [Halarsenatibacter silvermanii]
MNDEIHGEVYLVGGGPGDPGLLTCRGRQLLEEADIIIYDRLIETSLLNHAGEECELIYAGKKPGAHSLTQEEINQLMVDKASAGKKVVRLKGGDPFLFGRGGEEAAYLEVRGIAFQVVPGITSALSVPAYAGIPATMRKKASSAAVITGHEDPDKEESSHSWRHLARGPDTLIFLMGVGNLPRIKKRLIKEGLEPETPAAIIERGTRPGQKTIYSRLKEVDSYVEDDKVSPPAVIVIGEVAGEGEKLSWFKRRPLRGLRILNTRPAHQARRLTRRLQKAGAVVREAPAISIVPPRDFSELDDSLADIDDYDWIVFTSQNGVASFFRRLQKLGIDIRQLAGVKLAAIGSRTADKLEEKKLTVDFTPEEFVAEEVLSGLRKRTNPDDKLLLPRTPRARSLLVEGLREDGLWVDEVTAYRTEAAELPEDVIEDIDDGSYDLVTFTSSSTVTCLCHQLESEGAEFASQGAAIGPITAETARDKGLEVAVTAEEYTCRGLYQAVLAEFGRGVSANA